MLIQRARAHASEILNIFIQDSASTTGAGKTGLLHNTASLTARYMRSTDTSSTSISLVTMTKGTYTSGGFIEIDATNMPGWYQFCPPDAVFASGTNTAIQLQGASGMAPCPIGIELISASDDNQTGNKTFGNFTIQRLILQPVDASPPVVWYNGAEFGPFINLQDGGTGYAAFTYAQIADLVTTAVRGATVLPTSGTLPTVGTGSNQIALSSGNVTTGAFAANALTSTAIQDGAFTAAKFAASSLDGKGNWNIGKTGYSLTPGTGLGNQTANITGNLSGSVGSVTGNVGGNVTGSVGSISGITFPTNFSALGINTSGHVSRVVLTDTTTNLTNGGGGGGSTTVYLSPLQTSVLTPIYTVNGATTWPLDIAQNSTPAILFAVTDGDGNPVSLSGKTVRLVAHDASKPFTTRGELETGGAGITIGGTDNNQVTATFTTNITGSIYSGAYKLWNVDDKALLSEGPLVIRPAPIDHT